jgi:[ribosomal protein S18]-alanine N-acetyltransferase
LPLVARSFLKGCIMMVQWMVMSDLETVCFIEKQSFQFAWSRAEFLNQLGKRNTIGMVAEEDDTVVGFMVYTLCEKTIVLENLAVAPQQRRKGYGKAMIEKLVSKLSPERRSRVTSLVRETNLDAQLFLRSCGFRCVGAYDGAYEETDEQGYCFVKRCESAVAVA